MNHRIPNYQHTGHQKIDVIKHQDEFAKPVLFETPKADLVFLPSLSNYERHKSDEKIGKSRGVLLRKRRAHRNRAD